MKLVCIALAALAAALISGCASGPPVLSEGGSADKSKGILLASITANSRKHTHDAWFYYRKVGAEGLQRLAAMSSMAPAPFKPNDFRDDPDRMGNLVALPLDAGDYELVTWTLYIQTFGGNGYLRPQETPPPIRFSIRPGRVTYLGAMHIETLMAKNLLGFEIAAGGSPEFGNKERDDKLLMKRKFPALGEWPFDPNVPSINIWKPGPMLGDPQPRRPQIAI